MRISWCLVWIAILVAIVLCIPLIERNAFETRTRGSETGENAPLLPAPPQRP
ncbi:hypothetical protein SAMN05880590_101417 [Rhizobium sp. RU35A]|uniref:hypothetical protein n=1 Tax=Rhizobium TaxID=379 RepID=UPI000955020C|nr:MULTISPECIES: hypothetical protein [Rhizobium]SIP95466.1 hypothetical protein SAMN05880590_101417 [Rhizobium sp. RU35A]